MTDSGAPVTGSALRMPEARRTVKVSELNIGLVAHPVPATVSQLAVRVALELNT